MMANMAQAPGHDQDSSLHQDPFPLLAGLHFWVFWAQYYFFLIFPIFQDTIHRTKSRQGDEGDDLVDDNCNSVPSRCVRTQQ